MINSSSQMILVTYLVFCRSLNKLKLGLLTPSPHFENLNQTRNELVKKVFLHIGLHKTGSSSIQTSLFSAKNEIEKQGFSYFCTSYNSGENIALPQDWVALRHLESPKLKEPKKLIAIINSLPQDKVIVSIEALSWFSSKKDILKLANTFKTFDLKVVIYLRRQDQQYVSYIQEGSKDLDKPSRRYYGHSVDAIPALSRKEYLNYYNRVTAYYECFGYENVVVKDFNRNKLVSKDVVADFCSTVGLNNVKSIRVNESLMFKSQKVGHLINLTQIKDKVLTRFLRDRVKKSPDTKKMLPSRESAKEFYNTFIEGNKKLNSYLGGHEGTDFFDDDFSMYPESRSDIWCEEDANQVIMTLLQAFVDYKDKESNPYASELRDAAIALKDSAIALESENILLAYKLMKRAQKIRPTGPVINQKLTEYEKIING